MVPALLRLVSVVFGALPGEAIESGEPCTRRHGRIYDYYVAREAIADGYDSCAVTSMPAAEVEGAVLDRVQRLLAAPELVGRTWATAKRGSQDEIAGREVTQWRP